MLLFAGPTYAYLDPGTGSMLLQAVLAVFLVIAAQQALPNGGIFHLQLSFVSPAINQMPRKPGWKSLQVELKDYVLIVI
jgi:hypothetical protein